MTNMDRLGFIAWADNLIVNTMEDMCGNYVDATIEKKNHILTVRKYDKHATFFVRAYIDGKGWVFHERTVKTN